MTAVRAVRFRVTGVVQGVGFRAFARRSAVSHGVAGFARNADDGSVVGVAEGAPSALAAFLADLRRGPPAARVSGLEQHDADPRGATRFEIG